MLRLTEKLINDYNMLIDCKTVIAAVSGGADSVCMLGILQNVCSSKGIDLICAHFNHNLRGKDSDADEAYVKELCLKLGIPFYRSDADVASIAKQKGISIETAAREERYAFLFSLANSFESAKIATAHTANDNAETVLLNITRGSGLKGLCGIPAVRDNIIRPILLLSRKDTESYCKENGLDYVTDKTNFDTKYSRNKIRLNIIPQLLQVNNEAVNNICKAAKILEADNKCLESIANKIYEESFTENSLNTDIIKSVDDAILARIILRFIKENTSVEYDNLHINEAIKLIKFGKTGDNLQLAYKLFLEISYNRLILSNGDTISCDDEIIINGIGEYAFCNRTIVIEQGFNTSDKRNSIDYSKIKFPLILRTPKQGDKFKIPKVGTKPVNRLLTDRKIPRSERGILPLLSNNEEVVWIYGVGASENYKADKNTEKYINIKIKEKAL